MPLTSGLLLAEHLTRSASLLRRATSTGKTHRQALRQLANRWVGILHGCLEFDELYDEAIAWPTRNKVAA